MVRLNILLIIISLMIAACSFAPEQKENIKLNGGYYQDDGPPTRESTDPKDIVDAIPREESPSRYGNIPYTVFGKRYYPIKSSMGYREIGEASWYGKKFHGRKTSSGEVYDMYKMTAAHKTLPLPTYVRVRRIDTGETVVVRVNDRGPFLKGRIIDLSYAAAQRIGLVKLGKANVEVVAIDKVDELVLPRASGRFLEAAHFRLPENAEHLRERLLSKGLTLVDIITEKAGEIVYYRVRVGPIEEKQSLDQYIFTIQSVTGVSPTEVLQ